MRKRYSLKATTLFALLTTVIISSVLFSACNRSTVSLAFTNARDEVPALGNLIFRFDKPLAKDSMLEQWDSTPYVDFEPKIAGRFRWEHPDELVFSPSQPLTPATSFRASLQKDLLKGTPYGSIKKGEDLIFHTPDLQLSNTNVTWVLQDENSSSAVPQLDLQFNYAVDPNALKDKLQILKDGQPLNYTLQSLSAEDRISVRLLNLKMEDKNIDIKIGIDKGLVPKGGTNGLKDKLESSATIPSPFVLQVNDVTTEHDGETGTIRVMTSQQVVEENLASYVTLSPGVKFTVQTTDDGFLIRSDNFDQAKSYSLTLGKGLRGRIGGVLHEEYTTNVTFGELAPAISFTNSKGVYLSGKGARNIEIKIVNVPKVKIIVSKIYENNLLMAQRFDYTPKENSSRSHISDEEGDESGEGDGGGDGGDYSSNSDVTLGDVIYEQEVDTRSLPKSGSNRLFNFNIADKLPEFKGIYHVMIRSSTDYWVRDSRFVSLSDIGLIAREGKDKILVFANSIKNAAAINGVNVLAYGANNQLLGMGATNADGVAEIAFAKKELAGFKPAMIIAKTADDFNYLPFGTTRVNTSQFEVGGRHSNTTGLDAFIYPERDIYRPGERVNFSVIVRDRQWHSPGELPMKLSFLLPNGKELRSFRKSLNDQGSLEGSVDIAATAITGSYSLEVYTSNDVLLGRQAFRIEEFVPDRIKVTTKLEQSSLTAGESTNLNIHAVNFFGPPAANRNYECEIQVRQRTFSPKKYYKYDFSLANQNTLFDKDERQGKTDEKGDAVEKYTVPAIYKNVGLLQSVFYSTVFDETGRPVSRSTAADIYTQPVFFGVADDGYYWYALNQPVEFPLIAMDKNERVLNSIPAKVEVVKHEYRTVLTKSGNYFRYESQKEDKLVASSIVSVSGENTHYSFVPRSPGDYELRVYIPGANAYVSKDFYSYGAWGGDNNSFEVNNEGHIDISVEKESYLTGENMQALFKTPFDGRMLVTLETDKVVSYQYVTVNKRTASVTLPLSADDLPNVYITATLIKPHELSDIPLTVAHGFQSVKVEEKDRQMPVDIVAEKSVRSHTHQKIKVHAAPGSMVTLAAVDNGVLQVSDFTTPDPYAYFYAKRALEVNGYDIYPLLFPEVKASLSSTGGDADLKKRSNPMPAKRIKILSYWSGIVKANGSGEAEFDLDIPQFSGEVRLMALAYKNERFGARESSMTVADPIVLSSALPRFLSPGDTVTMPVTITNTTANSATANAHVKISGNLRIAGSDQQSLTIPANSEGRAVFQLSAPPAMGIGKVSVDVNSMGEHFTDETEIGVRPSAPLQKVTGSGSLSGGSSQEVNWSNNDFIPSSVDYKLVVSRSPAVELSKYLDMLVEYPYGCTEQTVSTAFPQLYYGDLADMVRRTTTSSMRLSANANIQEAIRKIKMRQLYNGAVTLWDNEGTENWWATIYSAHFLLEAGKAGFDVDKGLLETMLGYINGRLRNKETITYYYNRDQNKKIVPKEVIYGLYVLALANKPNVSVMNYYKANPQLLSLDCKYLLSAAYALAGDKKSFREFLPTQFAGEESVAQTGGSFYSDIRDESLALDVLADVDPENAQIPIMAKHVADKLKQRYWFSTQELAFSFLGLGKVARQSAGSTATADIRVDGRTVATMNGNPVKLTTKDLQGGSGAGVRRVSINSQGNGRLYYYWETEGISASGTFKEEDSYLKVRRKFFDRNGRPLSGNTFHQNDLVIVQVTLEKSFSTDIDNVVVTDMIPAGFEIENPRTKDIPGMDWIKDQDSPTALDVRDDRINLFVDVHGSKQVYYYAVRAVSPGTYRMGPVSADAMYNGEYHSYNGAGTVKVVE